MFEHEIITEDTQFTNLTVYDTVKYEYLENKTRYKAS